MHVKRTAIEIYRELISSCGCVHDRHNDGIVLQMYFKEGKEPPKELLPGALIKSLSPEDREELKKLTSEEVMKERLF